MSDSKKRKLDSESSTPSTKKHKGGQAEVPSEGEDSKSVASIISSIENRECRVGILGMGYVGLPLAELFINKGFHVKGFDVSEQRCASRRAGDASGSDLTDDTLKALNNTARLTYTTDFSEIKDVNAVIICVPTPLSKHRTPDLSFINSAVAEVKKYIKPNSVCVLESTTYPGCTNELMVSQLEKAGFAIGDSLFCAFSPERVDPGNTQFKLSAVPKVMGGYTPACLKVSQALYGSVFDTIVPVESTQTAEMCKLLENTFRAINIGLVNELALMADRMGINLWNVINAAKTKPFGFMAFTPGPGIGGHCIPLDPQYLSYTAKTFQHYNRFIELASDVNENMPRFVINKVIRMMNNQGKCLKNAKVMVVGLAYKKNVSDVRESPSLYIWEHLQEMGASVSYHDSFCPTFSPAKSHFADHSSSDPERYAEQKSVTLSPATLAAHDLIIICTDHDYIDWRMLLECGPLIFDSRNALAFRAFDKSHATLFKEKVTVL